MPFFHRLSTCSRPLADVVRVMGARARAKMDAEQQYKALLDQARLQTYIERKQLQDKLKQEFAGSE